MVKKKYSVGIIIAYILVFALAALIIFPVFYTIMASFKSNQELLTAGTDILPREWVFDNYIDAWTLANFDTYLFNSIIMAACIVTGVIINCTIGGYVFSRGEFRGKKFLWSVFTMNMLFSLGSMTLLPQYQISHTIGLTGLSGVIIVRIFSINVANLMIMKGFVDSIPRELDEAARIDGCTFFQTYYKIIFPLLKPIIATVGLLSFKAAWNDYLLPMVFTISHKEQTPLVVGIMQLKASGEGATSWNLMLAGSVLSIAPMLIIYLFLRRYFISGLTSGAIKG